MLLSIVLDPPRGLLEAPPGGFTGVGPFFDATLWRRKYEVLGANLPASEVLFSDGTVRRRLVVADRSELTLERDVTEGLDDGVPPLRLDAESRRVLGDIEFRVVDEEGNAPEGEPVIEAFNDEEVKVRLQIRTEVPLNRIRYDLRWLSGMAST